MSEQSTTPDLAVTHSRAKGKSSGLTLDLYAADVYGLVDGKVVRATLGYADRRAALVAVGLAE